MPVRRKLRFVPPVDVLVQRLQQVEDELQVVRDELAAATDPQTLAATCAHEAALEHRKTWYLARIRLHRPVTNIEAAVSDTVSVSESQ